MAEGNYEEWFKRIGVDPTQAHTIRALQDLVRKTTTSGQLSAKQMQGISKYFQDTHGGFQEYGVKQYTYTYLGVSHVRYTIPGRRGGFGFPKASEYVQEQMEA
jgi:hypothetical protein